MIRTIIFDLGGVYFTDGTKQAVGKIADRYQLTAEQVSDVLRGELGTQYRVGALTADEFWQRAMAQWHIEASADELAMLWIREYTPIAGTIEIVRALAAAGYELLFLSDNVKERVEYLEQAYHFRKLFRDGVFSHVEGCRKPDERIYRAVLAKTHSRPEDCVFIDDKEPLLAPARRLGMQTILFKRPDGLRDDLQRLGVRFS